MVNSKKIIFLLTLLMVLGVSCEKKEDQKKSKADEIKVQSIFILGSVTQMQDGKEPNEVKVKDYLLPRTTLRTKDNSMCYIKVGNLGIAKLFKNSEIKVNQLVKNFEIQLNTGKISNKINVLANNTGFSIRTPSMTVGVRGTVFSVEASKDKTIVSLLEGKVLIQANKGYSLPENKTEEILEAGSQITIHISSDQKIELKKEPVSKEEAEELKNLREIMVLDQDQLEEIEKKIDQKEKELDEALKKAGSREKKIILEEKTKLKEEKKTVQANLDQRKTKMTLEEIKSKYKKVEEFSLYNGRVLKGAVIKTEGSKYLIQTENGQVAVDKDKDVKQRRTIQ